jgi:uncharacterized membrane protein YhaH (DUF805 family)
MSFPDAVRSGLQNYVNFNGRARRSEYWWFALFSVIVLVVARVLDSVIGTSPLLYLLAVAALVLPLLGLGARRLHDTDRTAWWLLLYLTVIGGIALLVFYALEGTPGDNQYGPSPEASPVAYGA